MLLIKLRRLHTVTISKVLGAGLRNSGAAKYPNGEEHSDG